MTKTKHKFFKIALLNQATFDLDKKVEQSVNDFLADPNFVYVNHSITVLSNTIDENDIPKLMNRFVLISLIYKDLKDTTYKLDKVSPKVQNIVKKSFEESGEVINSNIETEFDKKMKSISEASKIQEPVPMNKISTSQKPKN
jgi:ABC-type uncharacterized transport system ATPase subunit